MGEQKRRVSVVLSARNAGAMVRRSLLTVRAAMGPHDEVIAVDDGSMDDTAAQIGRALQGSDFQLIRTAGVGLTRALEAAVVKARGRYIARLDADDTMSPARLDEQVAAFEEDARLVVCGSNVTLVDDEYRPIGDTAYPESDLGIRACLLAMMSPFVHSTLMIPRAALLQAGNYRPYFKYSQDYDLVLRLSLLGRLRIVTPVLGEYVVSSNGISAKRGVEQRQFARAALAEHVALRLHLPHKRPNLPVEPTPWTIARLRIGQQFQRRTLELRRAGHPQKALAYQASGWCLNPAGSAVGAAVHAMERLIRRRANGTSR